MSSALSLSALARWAAPEPRDMPQWRAQLCDYTPSHQNMLTLAGAINAGNTAVLPVLPGVGYSPGALGSQLLAKLETQRLTDAALYYVTADMTALALAAAQVPPTEPVAMRRLPAPAGLMLFEQPIGGYRQDLREVLAETAFDIAADAGPLEVSTPIVAVSWSVWTPHDIHITGAPAGLHWVHQHRAGEFTRIPDHFNGIWLTFYAGGGNVFAALPPAAVVATGPDGSSITAGQVAERDRRVPLVWDNESVLAFGRPLGPAEPDTTAAWTHVVYTAWQLITQTGKTTWAEVEEVPRDRAGRRRDDRAGITGPQGVRIVRVHSSRRPSAAAAEQDAAASTGRHAPQWTCRWPVQPYRRNSCLNPRAHADGGCEHEDRLVDGHIKGPAGLPLRTGETVHLWDSQP